MDTTLKYIANFLLLLLAVSGIVYADAKQGVNLKIESIECKDRQKKLMKSDKITIHESIKALKPKLKKLPYKSYHLDSVALVTLPDSSRYEVTLNNGDTLALQLLYFEDSRVGLEIDWRDNASMKLLETRMHFNQKDTMLAGAADESGDRAKMLAISLTDEVAEEADTN